ncbi:MAG: DUF2490 domain-containing protein [Methylohalobius sp.]|nr:DUF2490 domain-containing protein [Methylohalobius sp.]
MRKYSWLSAFLLLFSAIGQAETQEDFRLWSNVTAVTNLGRVDERLARWRLWTEVQNRWRDMAKDADLDQLLVRLGLGYALTGQLTAWAGYGYIPTFTPADKVVNEHRLWQQLLWVESFGPWHFSSRTRLEERFIEGAKELLWRYRQFVRLSYPLSLDLPVSLVLWDEVFFHLNSASPAIQSGFDQNRAFLGIGWQPVPTTRIEAGYLNQFLDLPTLDRVNHIVSLNLFFNF